MTHAADGKEHQKHFFEYNKLPLPSRTLAEKYNMNYYYKIKLQEDQWSCKCSPGIWILYKHKTYKTWIKWLSKP